MVRGLVQKLPNLDSAPGKLRMKQIAPTQKQIASRAYQIFLERGCQHGHDRDDWLQAEYELMHLPVHKLAEIPPRQPRKSKLKLPSIIHVVRKALVADRNPRAPQSAF